MLPEKPSTNDDARGRDGALVEDERKPWWADDPELMAIRRRTLQEFDRQLDQREPVVQDAPDPVVVDLLAGTSWRELAAARDDLARARARYEEAVGAARAAGLSWGEIGRALGVSKQLLHRRFRTATAVPPAP